MAKPSPAQEPSVEEILASIRRIISDDERAEATAPLRPAFSDEPRFEPRPADMRDRLDERDRPGADREPRRVAPPVPRPAPVEARPAAPTRGFFPEIVSDSDKGAAAPQPARRDARPEARIAPRIEPRPESRAESRAEPRLDPRPMPAREIETRREIEPKRELARPRLDAPAVPAPARDQAALLSPSADAAVTAAFNSLASTILSSDARNLDEMARDMLRPMLKAWLDANLPPLVERLVREEIERVARGRQ